jgi:hypothetical protein
MIEDAMYENEVQKHAIEATFNLSFLVSYENI